MKDQDSAGDSGDAFDTDPQGGLSVDELETVAGGSAGAVGCGVMREAPLATGVACLEDKPL